jgi:hypothetical protein
MTVTDLIYRLIQRSDTTWSETVEGDERQDTLHLGYSGDESRRETVRSILQQCGVRLSEVERLREEGVILDVVLDDYHVGLRCSLDHVWVYTDYTRERLLTL